MKDPNLLVFIDSGSMNVQNVATVSDLPPQNEWPRMVVNSLSPGNPRHGTEVNQGNLRHGTIINDNRWRDMKRHIQFSPPANPIPFLPMDDNEPVPNKTIRLAQQKQMVTCSTHYAKDASSESVATPSTSKSGHNFLPSNPFVAIENVAGETNEGGLEVKSEVLDNSVTMPDATVSVEGKPLVTDLNVLRQLAINSSPRVVLKDVMKRSLDEIYNDTMRAKSNNPCQAATATASASNPQISDHSMPPVKQEATSPRRKLTLLKTYPVPVHLTSCKSEIVSSPSKTYISPTEQSIYVQTSNHNVQHCNSSGMDTTSESDIKIEQNVYVKAGNQSIRCSLVEVPTTSLPSLNNLQNINTQAKNLSDSVQAAATSQSDIKTESVICIDDDDPPKDKPQSEFAQALQSRYADTFRSRVFYTNDSEGKLAQLANIGTKPQPQVNMGVKLQPQVNIGTKPQPQVNIGTKPQPQVNIGTKPQPQVNIGVRQQLQVNMGVRPQAQVNIVTKPQPQVNKGVRQQLQVGIGAKPQFQHAQIEKTSKLNESVPACSERSNNIITTSQRSLHIVENSLQRVNAPVASQKMPILRELLPTHQPNPVSTSTVRALHSSLVVRQKFSSQTPAIIPVTNLQTLNNQQRVRPNFTTPKTATNFSGYANVCKEQVQVNTSRSQKNVTGVSSYTNASVNLYSNTPQDKSPQINEVTSSSDAKSASGVNSNKGPTEKPNESVQLGKQSESVQSKSTNKTVSNPVKSNSGQKKSDITSETIDLCSDDENDKDDDEVQITGVTQTDSIPLQSRLTVQKIGDVVFENIAIVRNKDYESDSDSVEIID